MPPAAPKTATLEFYQQSVNNHPKLGPITALSYHSREFTWRAVEEKHLLEAVLNIERAANIANAIGYLQRMNEAGVESL